MAAEKKKGKKWTHPGISKEGKAAISAAQKKRWALYRKGKVKAKGK